MLAKKINALKALLRIQYRYLTYINSIDNIRHINSKIKRLKNKLKTWEEK